jgi:hypothetical protein
VEPWTHREDSFLMSLMTLVRLAVLLILGWTLTALGIGALSGIVPSGDAPTYYLPQPALHEILSAHWPGTQEHHLVDLATGRSTAVHLPPGEDWSLLSISPWRDPRGELEAVGRWVSRDQDVAWGWGVVRLSDGAVLGRIGLEKLPTSRPCWIPGRLRSILYGAGDGRLYQCTLPTGGDTGDSREPPRDSSGQAVEPLPPAWRVPPPGLGEVFLADPVGSSDPRLRKWVIVALSVKRQRAGRVVFQQPRLWWLEMSERADAILAAGPLSGPAGDEPEPADDTLAERLPSLAARASGSIYLVWLARRAGEESWRLRWAVLGFDSGTGRPHVDPDTVASIGSGAELATAPQVLSADGRRVFRVASPGRIASLPVTPPSD